MKTYLLRQLDSTAGTIAQVVHLVPQYVECDLMLYHNWTCLFLSHGKMGTFLHLQDTVVRHCIATQQRLKKITIASMERHHAVWFHFLTENNEENTASLRPEN